MYGGVVVAGAKAGVSGASGATVSVMLSPVMISDVVTGPGGGGGGGSAELGVTENHGQRTHADHGAGADARR